MLRSSAASRHAARRFAFIAPLALAGASASGALAPVGTTSPTGESRPVDNRQPTLAMNYAVRTYGSVDQVGEVRAFAGYRVPFGYQPAHGRTLSVAGNAALFSKLGGTYGGNGATTFALPDLRGRVAVGTGGTGDDAVAIGQQFGSDSVTLGLNNLGTHGHVIPATANHSAGTALPTGGSQPFDNRQASLGLNYSIVTSGNFPSRDESSFTSRPILGEVRLSASVGTPRFRPRRRTARRGRWRRTRPSSPCSRRPTAATVPSPSPFPTSAAAWQPEPPLTVIRATRSAPSTAPRRSRSPPTSCPSTCMACRTAAGPHRPAARSRSSTISRRSR